MPRRLRFAGGCACSIGPWHVSAFFAKNGECEAFEKALVEAKERTSMRVLDWCVMPTSQRRSQMDRHQTSYVAVMGRDTAWAGDKPRKLADIGKEASTTIMLVEVTHSGIA